MREIFENNEMFLREKSEQQEQGKQIIRKVRNGSRGQSML